jgi:hypothetical protein
MSFCPNCGSEIAAGETCKNCSQTTPLRTVAVLNSPNSGWVAIMFRTLLLFQVLAVALYGLGWAIGLVIEPGTTNLYANISTLTMVFGVVLALNAVAFLRSGASLFIAYLLVGFVMWTLSDIVAITYLLVTEEISFSLDLFSTIGTFDDLGVILVGGASAFSTGIYGVVTTLGLVLLSFAYFPFLVIGTVALAQEAISANLATREKTKSATSDESPLAIITFVAAFVAPLAGLVLGLIATSKWQELSQRSRGLTVAALVISAVGLLISFIVLVSLVATPVLMSLFEGLLPW